MSNKKESHTLTFSFSDKGTCLVAPWQLKASLLGTQMFVEKYLAWILKIESSTTCQRSRRKFWNVPETHCWLKVFRNVNMFWATAVLSKWLTRKPRTGACIFLGALLHSWVNLTNRTDVIYESVKVKTEWYSQLKNDPVLNFSLMLHRSVVPND